MDMEELGYFIFMEEQEEEANRRMMNGRHNASRLLAIIKFTNLTVAFSLRQTLLA